MRKLNIHQIGWVVSAVLAGVFFTMGFQAPKEKLGVVDIASVVEKSDLGKANLAAFGQRKGMREALLEFVDGNRVMTDKQAIRLRELSVKDAPTAVETDELGKLKKDIGDASRRLEELSAKANPTQEEKTLVEEYGRRSQAMERTEQRWYQDFSTEMQQWADEHRAAAIEKARAASAKVAQDKGFTLVFEEGVAPFGVNDITDDSLKSMNAAK